MMKLLIINGPNINLLGIREKDIYGENSYSDLVEKIRDYGMELGFELDFFQSNIEGEIINSIQNSRDKFDGLIINPGAYSHYSIAILDALRSIEIPIVEVHLSNISKREDYRKKSLTSEACTGIVSGFGFESYLMAMDYFRYINKK